MDRAVLDAYGWTDITPEYDFFLQLDDRERYTWSEDSRDKVLARLLEENQHQAAAERTAEEARAKVADELPTKKRGSTKAKKANPGQLALKGSE